MNYIDFTINGHRYTNDPSVVESAGVPPEYQFIGYNAVAALANYAVDVVAVGGGSVEAARAAELAAAASAASAVVSPSTAASSTTSLLVGLGIKNFVMEPGKNFKKDMWVTLASSASPSTTFMNGPLASYDPVTGDASATITRAQGPASSFTDWSITLSAPAAPATGGSAVGVGTMNITGTGVKYQEMQPTGYGVAFNLTGAIVGIQGPAAFTLRNRAGTYPWDAQVRIGGLRGFVRANKTAYVDVVGAAYQLRDVSGYGGLIVKQVTFSGVVAGTAGLWTKAVRVASGGVLVLVHGANLHAVFVSAAGDFGPPLLIRTNLSAGGADGTVLATAVNDGTDNVLVVSIPEGGSAMQSVLVVVAPSGALELGNLIATPVAAIGRMVELRPVADSAGGLLFVVGLVIADGTQLLTYPVVVTSAGGSAHTVGTVRGTTTVGGVAALLSDPSVPNLFLTVVKDIATRISVQVMIVSAAGAQTPGATVTTTITSGTAVQVRAMTGGDTGEYEGWPWLIGYVYQNVVRVAKLTLSGVTPQLTAGAAVNSAITTVSSFSMGETLHASYLSVAACGIDATGRFLAEIRDFDCFDGAPTVPVPFGSQTLVALPAAITAVWIGPGVGGSYVSLWQLTTATEALVAMTLGGGVSLPTTFRMLNAGGYATLLQSPDVLSIKTSRHRTTLRSAARCLAMGDGSKPSMEYMLDSGLGEPTARPVALVAQLTFGSFNGEAHSDNVWVAAGAAPMTNLIIQNFKVA